MSAKVIAIDGPAYSGKSQIAKEVARLTGFEYINTGHMFRSLAKTAIDRGISCENEEAISNLNFEIHFKDGRTLVNGDDWTDKLNSNEIVQFASRIAVYPEVRSRLASMQREYAKSSFIIMEGRDIGSAVFPDAICRIYVTARPKVRAARLYKMMTDDEKRKNPLTDEYLDILLKEKLSPIDELDANRKVSPLISEEQAQKTGYFVYDNSEVPTARQDAENLYQRYIKNKISAGTSEVTESIEELRKICQTTAKKDKSNIYMRYVCRFLSIYGTRLILPTSITANQVSVAMIGMGIIANLFFLAPFKSTFFAGAFLLQIWYLIDCMDGEVARYRHYKATGSMVIDKRESSLTGLYYDMINHYIVNFLVPFTLGYGIYQQTHQSIWVLIGGLGALTQVLMLAMHDAKSRAILAHLKKYSQIVPVVIKNESEASKERSLLHWIFMALHYSVTYPTVMNLVGGAAILNLFSKNFDWRAPIFIYISFGTLIVSTVLIVRILKNELVDREIRESFIVTDATPKEAKIS